MLARAVVANADDGAVARLLPAMALSDAMMHVAASLTPSLAASDGELMSARLTRDRTMLRALVCVCLFGFCVHM